MARYTSDMLIRDVLVSDPAAASVFARYGLGCASCLASEMETVEAVAVMHDVPVASLLAELNASSDTQTMEDPSL